MLGASHAAYTNRLHELARLVPHLVIPEAMEPKTIQKAVKLASTLTDEALKNGPIKKNPEKRGNGGNLVRIGMEGSITRGLEREMILLQPQTLLGEVTWVRHPSVPLVAIIIYLRHLIVVVSTVTAHDILLGIVEWCLGM
ncbi:hypothetical protein Tco_0234667 [Tanacetum coccineum]